MARDSETGGKMDEMKGKAKQAAGDLTDNEEMRARGTRDEKLGEAKQADAEAREHRERRERV